jgi:hypothetical protein
MITTDDRSTMMTAPMTARQATSMSTTSTTTLSTTMASATMTTQAMTIDAASLMITFGLTQFAHLAATHPTKGWKYVPCYVYCCVSALGYPPTFLPTPRTPACSSAMVVATTTTRYCSCLHASTMTTMYYHESNKLDLRYKMDLTFLLS